jgi:hypothetical protein
MKKTKRKKNREEEGCKKHLDCGYIFGVGDRKVANAERSRKTFDSE